MARSTALVLLLATLSAVVAAAAATRKDVTVASATPPAIYVFGDSTADVGNNNMLPPDAPKANIPYYGIDYPGGVATGRYCNGYVGVDYIANGLGFRKSPPAFASVSNGVEMIRGVNFASGGSGIIDTLWKHVITMDEQIKNFEVVRANITAVMGKHRAKVSLSKSIFVFSTANNDLFAGFTLHLPTNDTQRDEIITPLINKFKSQLVTLYELGARKFAVSGTGLLGCVPALRRLDPSAGCNEALNALSMRFKNATKVLLENLSSTLGGFRYSFVDAYELGLLLNSKPHQFGFTELKAACCGTGRLNAEAFCSPNSTVCSDRRQYYFWDMVHPTQAAYRIVGDVWLHGSPQFCTPVNIMQLLDGIAPVTENTDLQVLPATKLPYK